MKEDFDVTSSPASPPTVARVEDDAQSQGGAEGACAATPRQELERQIMSSTVPKNEREWWARGEIERLRGQIDKLLAHCDDPECDECGKIICPHGDDLHFHHDGCPSCYLEERQTAFSSHSFAETPHENTAKSEADDNSKNLSSQHKGEE